MSIMPEPFEPAMDRSDPNYSNSEIINKIQCLGLPQTIQNESKQFKKQTCWKQKETARLIVENIYFQIFITIFTVASLFMEDIRIIFIDITADTIVDFVNVLFIIIFMLEILLSLSVPGYLCSFFFYLDILSTLSIVMDISLLTNLLYSSSALSSGLQLSVIIRNSKASRAAARTVRVMKIFRLARIVKLYKSATKAQQIKSKKLKEQMDSRLRSLKLKKIKQAESNLENGASLGFINTQVDSHVEIAPTNGNFISKLLAMEGSSQNKNQKKDKNKLGNSINGTENREGDKREAENQHDKIQQISGKASKSQSKISKLLSDNSMKKIILVILLLMFSVPILDTDNYFQTTSSWDFLSEFIVAALRKPVIPIDKINALILKQIQQNSEYEEYTQELILFKTPFKQLYYFDAGILEKQRVNDLAISETEMNVTEILQLRNHTLTLNTEQGVNSVTIILNCKQYNQIDSWFSIGKIIFICVGIIYILNTINENISQLITEPIEKMLEDVKNNGRSDFFVSFPNCSQQKNQLTVANNYETTNVHSALTKISNMISKFFGVKGKEHIYKKIFEAGTVAHNYLSSNKKSYCIIGLCNIQNYYQISQILKGESVNLNRQVSSYLHSAVHRYGGNGVANYQGSFLVAFEIPYEYHHLISEIGENNSQLRGAKSLKDLGRLHKLRFQASQKKQKEVKIEEEQENNYVNILADFSIFSFVKTLVKINKEPKFFKYRKDPKLIQALGDSFQIKINCTLHAGWVQEGFLGSNLKIDYFYFGKTVQELRRISHYCRKVSNGLVITNNVYNLITRGMKRFTRIIETYGNKQQEFEKQLYLVDLNFQNVSPPKNLINKKNQSEMTSVSLKRILNLQYLKDQQLMKTYKASIFINSKKELREVMKNVISEQFRRKYNEAYGYFKSGELLESKEIIEQLANFNREDSLVNRMNILIQIKFNTMHTFLEQKKDQESEALLW